jgi:hypothetical protein
VRIKPANWVLLVVLLMATALGQDGAAPKKSLNDGHGKPEPRLKTRAPSDVHSTRIPWIDGMQCVTFDPKTLTAEEVAHGPILHGHLHWLYGNEQSQDDRAVLRIIQQYGMNASCWIDDPNSPFHFMLVDGKAPTGEVRGEECFEHNLSNLHLVQLGDLHDGTRLRVLADNRDGQMRTFAFKTNRAAKAALTAIKRFAFTQECYFQRIPVGTSFSYLKAE